jgi:sulfide:quinone oxidoreductase
MSEAKPFRVVIAGGGVAALEAALALRDLLGHRAELELVAPTDEFVLRPLAVAEPFGLAEAPRIPLAEVSRDLGVRHARDALRGIDPEKRVARMESGVEIPYDALLIAIGAVAGVALPGALTYRGGPDNAELDALLRATEAGEVTRVAFVVPPSVQWPLPIYELALLSASRLRTRGLERAGLLLVTHEAEPLALFGRRASDSVRDLLATAGVELITGISAASVEEDGLLLTGGGTVPAEAVVAGPHLTVPAMAGVPQGPDGFIGTDLNMRVEGVPRVYAAGDSTWFPIKQGGVAAQQAEVAASTIASLIEPAVEARRFRPTLRGVLFTGGAPRYLRTEVGRRDVSSAASSAPLWWPPGKVAGRHLASYLEGHPGVSPPLEDLEPLHGEDYDQAEDDQRSALELALAAADADARWHDYRAALRWLEVAQELNLALPAEYAEKRERWLAAAGHGASQM